MLLQMSSILNTVANEWKFPTFLAELKNQENENLQKH